MPRHEVRGFWPRVAESESGCWIWNGGLNEHGYGVWTVNKRMYKAHRYAYEQMVGPIPDGLVLDHLCRTPRCVNPAHLEPVTQAENVRRAKAHITHCPRDHEYTPENTYLQGNRRSCKECRRVARNASYHRRRAAA